MKKQESEIYVAPKTVLHECHLDSRILVNTSPGDIIDGEDGESDGD